MTLPKIILALSTVAYTLLACTLVACYACIVSESLAHFVRDATGLDTVTIHRCLANTSLFLLAAVASTNETVHNTVAEMCAWAMAHFTYLTSNFNFAHMFGDCTRCSRNAPPAPRIAEAPDDPRYIAALEEIREMRKAMAAQQARPDDGIATDVPAVPVVPAANDAITISVSPVALVLPNAVSISMLPAAPSDAVSTLMPHDETTSTSGQNDSAEPIVTATPKTPDTFTTPAAAENKTTDDDMEQIDTTKATEAATRDAEIAALVAERCLGPKTEGKVPASLIMFNGITHNFMGSKSRGLMALGAQATIWVYHAELMVTAILLFLGFNTLKVVRKKFTEHLISICTVLATLPSPDFATLLSVNTVGKKLAISLSDVVGLNAALKASVGGTTLPIDTMTLLFIISLFIPNIDLYKKRSFADDSTAHYSGTLGKYTPRNQPWLRVFAFVAANGDLGFAGYEDATARALRGLVNASLLSGAQVTVDIALARARAAGGATALQKTTALTVASTTTNIPLTALFPKLQKNPLAPWAKPPAALPARTKEPESLLLSREDISLGDMRSDAAAAAAVAAASLVAARDAQRRANSDVRTARTALAAAEAAARRPSGVHALAAEAASLPPPLPSTQFANGNHLARTAIVTTGGLVDKLTITVGNQKFVSKEMGASIVIAGVLHEHQCMFRAIATGKNPLLASDAGALNTSAGALLYAYFGLMHAPNVADFLNLDPELLSFSLQHGNSPAAHATKIFESGNGGQIELIAAARIAGVNILIAQRNSSTLTLIECSPGSGSDNVTPTIFVERQFKNELNADGTAKRLPAEHPDGLGETIQKYEHYVPCLLTAVPYDTTTVIDLTDEPPVQPEAPTAPTAVQTTPVPKMTTTAASDSAPASPSTTDTATDSTYVPPATSPSASTNSFATSPPTDTENGGSPAFSVLTSSMQAKMQPLATETTAAPRALRPLRSNTLLATPSPLGTSSRAPRERSLPPRGGQGPDDVLPRRVSLRHGRSASQSRVHETDAPRGAEADTGRVGHGRGGIAGRAGRGGRGGLNLQRYGYSVAARDAPPG